MISETASFPPVTAFEMEQVALRTPAQRQTSYSSLDRALASARVAGELRGSDILLLDMRSQTDLFDYLVIATGHSRRQVVAMSEEIDRKLEEGMGDTRLNVAGKQEGRWIVLDYGDVVIHLFDDETRMFYSLENLWADAKRVDLTQTLAGLR